jgi:hypothetical protein
VIDTVEVDLISDQSAGQHMYSRGLSDPACSNQTAADFDAQNCIVTIAPTGMFLTEGNAAFRTLGNISRTESIRRVFDADGRPLAYLGPVVIGDRVDFQATTFAMHTQCRPIAAECDLHVESGASEPFHCNDSFYGNLPSRSINGDIKNTFGLDNRDTDALFFADTGLNRLADGNRSIDFPNHRQNPYYLGVWAYIIGMTATDELTEGGNVVIPMHGGITWLLNCEVTTYEMTYSWVNGTDRVDDLRVANGSMGTIVNAPIYYGLGKGAMESNAYSATGESNVEALAESYAFAYSRTAMALSSGIMSSRPTLLEQTRETVLVARIPKVPLYMLVAFNLLFAIVGIVLAAVALMGSPLATNDVRERLTIAGIVAFAFEGPRARRAVEKKREMFAEYSGSSAGSARLAIEPSQDYDGWEYTVRQDMKQIG